jgi:hypothetical protein
VLLAEGGGAQAASRGVQEGQAAARTRRGMGSALDLPRHHHGCEREGEGGGRRGLGVVLNGTALE